ncbi:hypothetical protein I4U23_014841 [Adineta vaga]|nr:hypothetical protein I4U23_014841 [Adineta vaga]
MDRNHYNLYVSNISDRTTEASLIKYFSQFGKIECFTFLIKCYRRHTSAAMITYARQTDMNYIIQHSQCVEFDNQTLFLRRTLPMERPAFERFMSSNELLVSLPSLSKDQQFNDVTIRMHFSQYGSIVFCRAVIPSTTYLIDFVNSNSVDCAILDEPHFYNDKQLILRKYVSINRLGLRQTNRTLSFQGNMMSRSNLRERIRRLNHVIEAIEFGRKVEIRLTKCMYEEKKVKLNKKQDEEINSLREKSNDLNSTIKKLNKSNDSLKLLFEQSRRRKAQLIRLYKDKLQQEQKRIKELKEAIDLLKLFE